MGGACREGVVKSSGLRILALSPAVSRVDKMFSKYYMLLIAGYFGTINQDIKVKFKIENEKIKFSLYLKKVNSLCLFK